MRHSKHGAWKSVRRGLACVALATCAHSLAGCSPSGKAPLEPEPGAELGAGRGGTVVIAAGVDITGVNQLTGGKSRFDQDIIDQLFLSLFEEQPDYAEHPPTFEPELAESHAWSDDGAVLRIRLKTGLVWSDGAPITSSDVVWTHAAQTDPEIAWPEAQSKDSIEKVVAVDERTVEFHFSKIYSSRLSDVNMGVILPKHAWSALPFAEWRGNEPWFREHLVVSGPFDLAGLEPQHQIVLERNPSYHRTGYPLLDRVVFRVIPDRTNRVEHLLSSRVDFVEHLPPGRARDIEEASAVELLSEWHRQYTYLGWNGCDGLFEDPNVRRAMTLAIDREAIVAALWGDLARPALSPILTSVWAFDRSLVAWPYDPGEASRLLASSGWVDRDGDGILDRDGQPFSFALETNGDNRVRADAAVMIQEHLARIGVEARVALQEFNSLWDRHERREVDAIIGAWGIDTSLDLKYAFHTESIDGGKNYGCYSNPEVDELIDRARRQAEPADAAPLLHQIQRILHLEQPYTFLWEPVRLYGVAQRLRDVRPNALSAYFNLEEWRLAPDAD